MWAQTASGVRAHRARDNAESKVERQRPKARHEGAAASGRSLSQDAAGGLPWSGDDEDEAGGSTDCLVFGGGTTQHGSDDNEGTALPGPLCPKRECVEAAGYPRTTTAESEGKR